MRQSSCWFLALINTVASFFLALKSTQFCSMMEFDLPKETKAETTEIKAEVRSPQELHKQALEVLERANRIQLKQDGLNTSSTGRVWEPPDPNAGFRSNGTLPILAILSINGQKEGKASWQYPMSFHNKLEYSKRWGYDLIIEDDSLIKGSNRHIAWAKFPAIKKWLPRYQWILCMDMDAYFMRFDLPVHKLANNDGDIIIAKDWNGINTGIFLMRNSPYTFQILDQLWSVPKQFWKPWEEQSALMYLTDRQKNTANADLHIKHMLHVPQREMNAYGDEFAYNHKDAQFQWGDRIVHFPNCGGFPHSCRSTMERFFNQMKAMMGLQDINATEVKPTLYYSEHYDAYP